MRREAANLARIALKRPVVAPGSAWGVTTQSTEVKPAHPQHALKLKAGCGFGFGGLGLDSPGLCL
jgi:hypothetical protein